MVTRDGRICGPVPYSAANSLQPGSRSAALSAPAGTACAVSDTHPGPEVTVLFEAGKTTSTFRISAGTGKRCIGMYAPVGLPGPDWPALRTCTKVRSAGSTAPQWQAVKGWMSYPPPAQRTGLSERVEAAVPIQHGNLRPIQHTEYAFFRKNIWDRLPIEQVAAGLVSEARCRWNGLFQRP